MPPPPPLGGARKAPPPLHNKKPGPRVPVNRYAWDKNKIWNDVNKICLYFYW